jgi:DNA ligase-1
MVDFTKFKPMLAATCEDTSQLEFPVLVTPKLDGIRTEILPQGPVSRTLKPIQNKYIRKELGAIGVVGMDGEIMTGKNFQDCSHDVMSFEGEPKFTYNVFDLVTGSLTDTYETRMNALKNLEIADTRIVKILPIEVKNEEELLAFETKCLSEGYEGVMIRSKSGKYKCGRSTLKEGALLKLKRFIDDEAIIVGFEPLYTNMNEAQTNELGRTFRSTAQDGLVAQDTLGTLITTDLKTGIEVRLGSGFDAATRKNIWMNQADFLGKLVKYKHFANSGVKDKMRHPIYLGIRSREDMGE